MEDFLCKKGFGLKFIYSEKATKFCEIFTLLLSVCTVDKSKVKISQNFVAFSEYTNFTQVHGILIWCTQWSNILSKVATLFFGT